MKKRWLFTSLLFCGSLLVSCTLPASEDAIATAIAETAEAEEIRTFYQAQTAEAQATDTPEPTATDTPIPTETPLPTSTPTPEPPAGMAYVPDFIDMPYEEASEILIEMESKKWYYVAIINNEVDEWTVVDQDPEPGTLIDLGDDRIKIIVAVYTFTPTPVPEEPPGQVYSDNCGDITTICVSYTEIVWCEGGELWIADCAAYCGGYCGWSVDAYYCLCP